MDTDDKESLRGETLLKAIEEDKSKGKIPFCVIATLGTTACCSFDNIQEIGSICREHGKVNKVFLSMGNFLGNLSDISLI